MRSIELTVERPTCQSRPATLDTERERERERKREREKFCLGQYVCGYRPFYQLASVSAHAHFGINASIQSVPNDKQGRKRSSD
jgi:hypothetical protein